MTYKRLVLGALGTNCYVLWDEKGEGVVIDPADNAAAIIDFLNQNNITLRWVWLTHAHFDHMLAAGDLLRQTGAQLAVHTKDAAALCDPNRNLSAWDPAFRLAPLKADRLLYEGDRLQVGEMCLTVLHTPGHTEGSCCFYDESKGVLFSGDTLFCCSVGRTDFPGGSMFVLQQSLHRLLKLPEETIVCPGHDNETTVGFERLNNPFIG